MNNPSSLEYRAAGLGDTFRTRFEVVPALTEQLREQSYRLRHQVYCEDLGFEPRRADARETDSFDSHATAILVRHVVTRQFIGCARLIHPRPDAPDDPLPFELTCRGNLDLALLNAQPLPRSTVAEVSRLAVISSFRRRKGETGTPAALSDADFEGGRFPYLLIGLYLGVVALGQLQGIERLFLLSEPRLAKHFSRLGVQIVQVGGPIEHRGTRIPSMISVSRLVAGLNTHVKPLYLAVQDQMRQAFDLAHSEYARHPGPQHKAATTAAKVR